MSSAPLTLGLAGVPGHHVVFDSRARLRSAPLSSAVFHISPRRVAAAADSAHLRLTGGTVVATTVSKLVRHRATVGAAAGISDATLPDGARWDVLATLSDVLAQSDAPLLGLIQTLAEQLTTRAGDVAAMARPTLSQLGANGLVDVMIVQLRHDGAHVGRLSLDSDGTARMTVETVAQPNDRLIVRLGHEAPDVILATLPTNGDDAVLGFALEQYILHAADTSPQLWGHPTVAGPAQVEIVR